MTIDRLSKDYLDKTKYYRAIAKNSEEEDSF